MSLAVLLSLVAGLRTSVATGIVVGIDTDDVGAAVEGCTAGCKVWVVAGSAAGAVPAILTLLAVAFFTLGVFSPVGALTGALAFTVAGFAVAVLTAGFAVDFVLLDGTLSALSAIFAGFSVVFGVVADAFFTLAFLAGAAFGAVVFLGAGASAVEFSKSGVTGLCLSEVVIAKSPIR